MNTDHTTLAGTTPEPLSAILAEMRTYADRLDDAGVGPSPTDLRTYADRIEAAAERERVKARRDAETEWARIGYDERKAEEKRAPGNAAAMREALVEILDRTNREKARDYDAAIRGGILEIHDVANTALNQERAADALEWKKICAACAERALSAASGNAAAMRAALEKAHNNIKKAREFIAWQSREDELLMEAQQEAKTALAAPARNCDRFDECIDAVDAWHREERCLGRHEDGGTCEKDPLASTLAPVCFARWLYAPAEGGAE